MKILFLDFDGVLNSEGYIRYKNRINEDGWDNTDLCPINCSNLQYVLDELPEVRIVISSAWRNLFEVSELKDFLKGRGIESDKVIDITPSFRDRVRGEEIKDWLTRHPEVKQYVIVDDNNDMLEEQRQYNFVHTDMYDGLTLTKAKKIVWLFRTLK